MGSCPVWSPERVLFLDPSTSIRPLTFLKRAGEKIKSSCAQSQNGKGEGALERLQIAKTRITVYRQTGTEKLDRSAAFSELLRGRGGSF